MKRYSVSHKADHVLLQDFSMLVAQDRSTTAELLAHLAEVDHRRLYLAKAYSSMYSYCVNEFHMSEETALRRIRVARASHRFPAILPALADGRLTMTAVLLLAPCLIPATADELLTAAVHMGKDQVELLLAQRFPRPDVPTVLKLVGAPRGNETAFPALAHDPAPGFTPSILSPDQVVSSTAPNAVNTIGPLALEPPVPSNACNSGVSMGPLSAPPQTFDAAPTVTPTAPPTAAPVAARSKPIPLSPGRYALQVTVDQETFELLRQAKDLLGHLSPAGDLADVLKRALDVLVKQLEQRKFAETSSPRGRRSHANGRYIPAEIKRAVRQRDGGRCTFVGDNGRRCETGSMLEFDHAKPVARGGQTTEDNLRLRCRAHNQFEADCVFGAGFMLEKRKGAPTALLP